MTKVVWAVGDGANGSTDGLRVAQMIKADNPDLFLYLGDVYESGSTQEFSHNYCCLYDGPGGLYQKTLPTPGNHEWGNRETGYDPHWKRRTKTVISPHYYSFRLGIYKPWQILSINSEEPHDSLSIQYQWLIGELAKSWYGKRRIAMWHRPRYNVGSHGNATDMEPIWQLLADKALIVLSGHAHNYQRFKPIDSLIQFVVGTGGRAWYDTVLDDSLLDAANADTFGALRMELDGDVARFRYIDVLGRVLDEGEAR